MLEVEEEGVCLNFRSREGIREERVIIRGIILRVCSMILI